MTARMRSRPGKRCQARYSSDFIALRLLNRVMVLSIGRNYHILPSATLQAPGPRNDLEISERVLPSFALLYGVPYWARAVANSVGRPLTPTQLSPALIST
jgi:hypothetical protein